MNNICYYYVIQDEDDPKMNIIAFCSEDEIDRRKIRGEGIPNNIQEICEYFEDTGELCEDYLIHTHYKKEEICKVLDVIGAKYSKFAEECKWY
jgi:hypothetical protein